jgi:DNA-binding GntR family transcriptional regulator
VDDLFDDLDRSSPVPLYFQVARQIEQAIEGGKLPPGSRLENEITLADRLGLSRPTMRRAIPEGSPVLHLRRLRFSADEPLAVLENWLPEQFTDLTEASLAERGMYQLLRSRGVGMRVARQRIGARRGTSEECQLLDEHRGSPLLTMERTTHDDSGRAVEWGRHVYRASRYAFEVTLVDR